MSLPMPSREKAAMNEPYLQVTYRHGRPWVAYLYLPRKSGEKSVDTELVEPEMVLDFNKGGKLIGIEILAPSLVTLDVINKVLNEHGLASLEESVLAPLEAA